MERFCNEARSAGRIAAAICSCLAVLVAAGLPAWSAGPDCNSLIRAGYVQMVGGASQDAVETLKAAVRANPASADARRYLACALVQAGLASQAVPQLEFAIRMAPPTAADLSLLGDACFYAGQYQKALGCYEKALSLDGRLDAAVAGIVHTYVAMGDTDRAAHACQLALRQARTAASRSKYESLLRDVQGDPNSRKAMLNE